MCKIRARRVIFLCKRDKSHLHFLITKKLCKHQIGAVGRNGLIGMSNLVREILYQTHYLHTRSRGGREQRERSGQKVAQGEGDTRIQRPVKNVGQSTPGPFLFFFFFHCK